MAEGNGAPKPEMPAPEGPVEEVVAFTFLIDPSGEMDDDLEREYQQRVSAAAALGNALAFRVARDDLDTVIQILDEVYDTLAGKEGRMITHVQEAQILGPTLDRLLAKVCQG